LVLDRFGLQLAADFYIFDLQTQVGDTDEFGNVSELVTVSLCIRYEYKYFASSSSFDLPFIIE